MYSWVRAWVNKKEFYLYSGMGWRSMLIWNAAETCIGTPVLCGNTELITIRRWLLSEPRICHLPVPNQWTADASPLVDSSRPRTAHSKDQPGRNVVGKCMLGRPICSENNVNVWALIALVCVCINVSLMHETYLQEDTSIAPCGGQIPEGQKHLCKHRSVVITTIFFASLLSLNSDHTYQLSGIFV